MGLQENFISNLKMFRKERRITQEKLAELCGTDTCYIGQIETRRRFPSIPLIEKMAEALQIEPHLLFEPGENAAKKKPFARETGLSSAQIKIELEKIYFQIKTLEGKL